MLKYVIFLDSAGRINGCLGVQKSRSLVQTSCGIEMKTQDSIDDAGCSVFKRGVIRLIDDGREFHTKGA